MNKIFWGILLAVCLLCGTAYGDDDTTLFSVPGHEKDSAGQGVQKSWSNSRGHGTQHLSSLTGMEKQYVDEGNQIEAEFLDDDLDFLEEEMNQEGIVSVADPLAPWNRVMFRFNDKFYFWFLKPVSSGYKTVVPTPVRSGVENFFANLSAPVRMGSCLAQGRGKEAQAEFARFALNTTFGVGGFCDPADDFSHLQVHDEDMGQALGAYGVSEGIYLVLPFLGPSTLRDAAGTAGDMAMNPATYLPMGISLGLTGEKNLNSASFRLGDYEDLTEAALDPYDAIRDAYLQHRKAKVEE